MEVQIEKIHAMAVLQGGELVDILIDAGESAKSLNRPGMARLQALIDKGGLDAVIMAKLDRLTRSVKDLAELLERFQRRGVALMSVAESLDTGSAAGRLVLNIMTSVSQWERESIGDRTRIALLHKKAHGRVYNHVPYGFVRDGDSLVPLAEEQAIVGRIQALRANGWPLRRIAEALNGDGVPTKQRGRWFPQTVKDILKNTLHKAAVVAA